MVTLKHSALSTSPVTPPAADSTEPTDRHLTQRDALEWAIHKLNLRSVGDRYRVILTTAGLAAIPVTDRFAEIAIDRHWAAIARALAFGDAADLAEFEGFDLDGYQLAFAVEQIPRACTEREGVR
jgi:hypothetical protein